MNLKDLRLRARALFRRQTTERELEEELAFHLECETRRLMATGLPAAEARRRALARFGPVPLAADACRDQRRIAGFENLVRDIGYAWRTFRRAPLVALTVVCTIGLGLGVLAVVFTFFNTFFLRLDAVRDPQALFAIERPTRAGARSNIPFTRPEYEAIRRETHVFSDVAATRLSVATRIDGRAARGMFVTGNFFNLLGVTAARGRTLTEADEADGGRPVIVLSHTGWQKLFAGDPGVIGRQLLVNGHPYDVAGVMPEGFRGLALEPQDYWAPLALLEQIRGPQSKPAPVDIIGRLPQGTTPGAAAAALSSWASVQPGIRKSENGIVHVTLRERRGVLSKDRVPAMLVFVPIFFAFALILMIGCANVANMLLARGLSRGREIGVRLSLGATRGRLVRQLLTESLLLALAAGVLGFAVARALLAGSIYLTLGLLPPEFAEATDLVAPPSDWRVWAFLLAAALVSTVMFGLVPALHATRLELVRAMRGEVARDTRPGRVRQLLIAGQVTASALLLVCAAVFLRSAFAAATADAGLKADDTLIVSGITEPARAAILGAVQAHPGVAAVAAASPQPTGSGTGARVRVGETSLGVDCKFVSPEYFDLLGVSLLRGRHFAADERTPAAGVVVISDTVARRLWPNAEPLGQSVRLEAVVGGAAPAEGTPQVPPQLVTVIGVVADVQSALTLFDFAYSGIYLPVSPTQARTSLVLRVHGDPDVARRALLDRLTRVDPALGGVTTMRMMVRLEGAILAVVFWMAVILGSLALLLTVSGLFGVLSYLVEQRRSEIGVRMALGATPRDIMRLVLSQSTRPIAAGVVAGGGLAAATAAVLLATPAAETLGLVVRAFDPLAYAASLAVIVTTCMAAAMIPARRAARIDPLATLKAD